MANHVLVLSDEEYEMLRTYVLNGACEGYVSREYIQLVHKVMAACGYPEYYDATPEQLAEDEIALLWRYFPKEHLLAAARMQDCASPEGESDG